MCTPVLAFRGAVDQAQCLVCARQGQYCLDLIPTSFKHASPSKSSFDLLGLKHFTSEEQTLGVCVGCRDEHKDLSTICSGGAGPGGKYSFHIL